MADDYDLDKAKREFAAAFRGATLRSFQSAAANSFSYEQARNDLRRLKQGSYDWEMY
jgi:hypothetical protein